MSRAATFFAGSAFAIASVAVLYNLWAYAVAMRTASVILAILGEVWG